MIRAEQPSLDLPEPPHGVRGGSTYDLALDYDRLNTQAADVWRVMVRGRWLTLATISKLTGHPEASVSARLRDYRKPQFGGHVVESRRLGNVFQYRLRPYIPATPAP